MAHIHVENPLRSSLLAMAYAVDGANSLQGHNIPLDIPLKNKYVFQPRF